LKQIELRNTKIIHIEEERIVSSANLVMAAPGALIDTPNHPSEQGPREDHVNGLMQPVDSRRAYSANCISGVTYPPTPNSPRTQTDQEEEEMSSLTDQIGTSRARCTGGTQRRTVVPRRRDEDNAVFLHRFVEQVLDTSRDRHSFSSLCVRSITLNWEDDNLRRNSC
jgi:hypothetical protein